MTGWTIGFYPKGWRWFVFYVESPMDKEKMDPENFNSLWEELFLGNYQGYLAVK
jgi:hypothetical protein